MTERLLKKLELGLAAMQLSLSEEQKHKLIAYLELLIKWNKTYNLTAIRKADEMVVLHLLDSLSVLPYIENTDLIDVGSGAGLPGIPLAICKPELEITSLDSNSKKTRFQQQVKVELELNNLTVVQARVEQYQVKKFKQIISRAFSSLADMVQGTEQLLDEQGVFLAMKGQYPEQELKDLADDIKLKYCHYLKIPSTDIDRHLLILEKH